MLRYGIIGSGNMGQEHIRYLKMLPDVQVAAVADSDREMRESAAALAGLRTQVFDDYRDLVAAGLVDALVIASPNHTHADILLDVLPANLPILAEKPLCTSVEDCRRVLKAAAGRTASVWVAMEYRYMPPVTRLIEEVKKGTIGKLHMLSLREHRYPFLHKVGDWNRFARNTGGTMVEKCCHFFDLMRLIIAAEPVRLYASGGQAVNHLNERYDGETPDIVDNAFVIVDFDNGVRACLDLCMFAETSRDQEEIAAVGDVGKIECGIPSSTVTIGRRKASRLERISVPVDAGLLAAGHHHGSTFFQHKRFFDMIRNSGAPDVTLEDGLKAVAMGAAAETSIRTGLPVRFADDLDGGFATAGAEAAT
jgi:predicted dehydrogenase